ncbi:hypothetical protein [Streptomyces spiralis]|uniref:hypothetical protein n=1 Tax=Streptomyces spiralis TaxID=66376 RepID=UPI0033D169FC
MSEDEVEGALALMDTMAVDALEGADFVDHYTEALEQVIETKREHREPSAAPEPEAEPGRVLLPRGPVDRSQRRLSDSRRRLVTSTLSHR